MRKLKKILGLMMCSVLAVGCLTGCGAKSDDEILMQAVTDVNSAKSYDIEATMAGKVSIKMEDETQEMDMNTVMTGTSFTDPYKVKASTTITVLGQTVKSDCYMQKEGDDYVVYVSDGTMWSKVKMSDQAEALQAAGMESNQLGMDVSKYKKQEDRTQGDKTYLVYDYAISGDEIKEMAEGAMSSIGALFGGDDSETAEIVTKMIQSVGDVTLTVLVDKEEAAVYRVEYPMTEMMNSMMDVYMSYMADKAKEEMEDDAMGLGEALASMEINVPEMNMVMTYKNINSAADFEIPADALDAEEVSLDESADAA